MDLSRVFGGDPIAAVGGHGHHSGGGGNFAGDEAAAFHEVARLSNGMQDQIAQLQSQLAQLNAAAEATRVAFQQVCTERDHLRAHVQGSIRRLTDVQRVVSRYAVVEDPVVASDGFTYERRIIEAYLQECRESKSEGISQQTKEVLTNTLLPNQSLRKLVDLLKTVKPEMLGTLPKSATDSTGDLVQRVANKGTEDDVTESDRPPAATKSQSGSQADGRLHPCIRVYGFCNYKDTCTYANYPYDACLSHLKGKCRFGNQCHEYHVDLKRPGGSNSNNNNNSNSNGNSANGSSSGPSSSNNAAANNSSSGNSRGGSQRNK